MLSNVRASWARWVEHQDPALAAAAGSPSAWVGSLLSLLAILLFASYVPGAREFFHLPFSRAVLPLVPVGALALAMGLQYARKGRLPSWIWAVSLVGNTLFQVFFAHLVVLSTVRGAAVFAGLFLFAAGYHGHAMRATFSEPFMALGSAIAVLLVLPLAPTDAHRAILGVVGVAATAGALVVGTATLQADRARADLERMRQALDAQMLEDRQREVGRLSRVLVDVLGASHDANNALMSAELGVETLVALTRKDAPLDREELRALAEDVHADLRQMAQTLLQARGTATDPLAAGDLVPVPLPATIDAVKERLAASHPHVRIELVDRSEGRPALLHGGEPTLRRVVENLLLNACQGDGTRGARRVTVAVSHGSEGATLVVRITDDGPGFPAHLLAGGIEGFATTKSNGTGLGLYTAERLVRASGGRLVRRNPAEGGAEVELTLPARVA